MTYHTIVHYMFFQYILLNYIKSYHSVLDYIILYSTILYCILYHTMYFISYHVSQYTIYYIAICILYIYMPFVAVVLRILLAHSYCMAFAAPNCQGFPTTAKPDHWTGCRQSLSLAHRLSIGNQPKNTRECILNTLKGKDAFQPAATINISKLMRKIRSISITAEHLRLLS